MSPHSSEFSCLFSEGLLFLCSSVLQWCRVSLISDNSFPTSSHDNSTSLRPCPGFLPFLALFIGVDWEDGRQDIHGGWPTSTVLRSTVSSGPRIPNRRTLCLARLLSRVFVCLFFDPEPMSFYDRLSRLFRGDSMIINSMKILYDNFIVVCPFPYRLCIRFGHSYDI